MAVDDLRDLCASRGKQVHFRLFEMYDLESDGEPAVSYADLARDSRLRPRT